MNQGRFPGAMYANIFSYKQSENLDGYATLDEETLGLVGSVPGYVGYENVKDQNGRSIFISYWASMEAVNEWRQNSRHQFAKSKGKEWYSAYHSMLVKIEYSSEHNAQIL